MVYTAFHNLTLQWNFYNGHLLPQYIYDCNKKLVRLLCQMTYFYRYVAAFVENDLILEVSTAPKTLSRRIFDEFLISQKFVPKSVDKAERL